MKQFILDSVTELYDRPIMQNNLRGLYVEMMVIALLGPNWEQAGGDWAGWDAQNQTGCRLEVKQSAKVQSWGVSITSPRFSIKAARYHYENGVTYTENVSGYRLADIYVFAWHEGLDQRDPEQWEFYAIKSTQLPDFQKSIGLSGIRRKAKCLTASELSEVVARLSRT